MKKTGKKLFSVIMAVLVVLTTTVSAFALTVNVSTINTDWTGSFDIYKYDIERLGASVTEYGILSARGGHLFEPVSVEKLEAKELKAQAMTDEKLEVVEVLGQTALFTNGRVTQKELLDGLYKYDLREGESYAFATIEPSVAVNYAGTIITKEPSICHWYILPNPKI